MIGSKNTEIQLNLYLLLNYIFYIFYSVWYKFEYVGNFQELVLLKQQCRWFSIINYWNDNVGDFQELAIEITM